MPIEIKELHIRLSVNATAAGQQAGGHPVSRGSAAGGAAESGEAKDSIVAECVEQVLHILRNRMER